MDRDRRLSLIVGGFLITGLAFFALAVLLLSSESGIFTPQYRLVAYFDNVLGLQPGAPVWLAGREVGRVDSVRFSAQNLKRPLEVSLRLDRSVRQRIRTDSIASIGTIGLLGDSYVEVSLGSPQAEVLSDGQEIQAVTPASLDAAITKGTEALESFTALAENLNSVVSGFSGGQGEKKLVEAITAVSDMVLEIQEGSGLLHSLIYDEYESSGVESISRSLAILESLLEEIQSGEGLMHSLIYGSPTDTPEVAQLLQAGTRLDRILASIESGEGTLGLLIQDPTLYEELVQLLGGAQRSVVVRSLIRLSGDDEGGG